MLFYLQAYHPGLPLSAQVPAAMCAGISTSLILETLLLRFGKDQMPLGAAARTAWNMLLADQAHHRKRQPSSHLPISKYTFQSP